MKNYFIFASDKRAYLDTINVVKELKKRNINYFYLFSQDPVTQFPTHNLDNFSYDTNVEFTNNIFYNSININLPFKPDVVLLTRESWQPQSSIIHEFKQHGSIISCIENAVWIIGTIKSRLEMISRFKYPGNCIDIFFENSQWSLDTKKICGWYDFKSVIVGNPKYDHIKISKHNEDSILVFGTMEKQARYRVYDIIQNLIKHNKQVYFRPHPGEIEQNNIPEFPGVEIIKNESFVMPTASRCNYHLGNLGASAYYSILFNKSFICLDEDIRINDLDINFFKGNEYDFWAPIIDVTNWEDFVKKIDLDRIEKLKERLNEIKNNIVLYDDKLNFLNNSTSSIDSKFFDSFNDQKASIRIVDFLENL